MPQVTGRVSKYANKVAHQQNGTYHGPSPFYTNIPEFQHLKPLHLYPHLKGIVRECTEAERIAEQTRKSVVNHSVLDLI